MSKLSVVLPAYNEELMVGKPVGCWRKFLQSEDSYELVVVNDGSGDGHGKNSEGRREGCECDRRSFSRNFGKEAAILQDWRRPVEMWWLSWTVTCSIRRRRLLRCTGCGRKAMK